MGAILAKFCLGETDMNVNGVPDIKEIVSLVQTFLNERKYKENKKRLKKILK